MRGHKTWLVLVEDELYNKLDHKTTCMLLMMMIPYELLGGRIVKVKKCEQIN